MTPDQFRNIRHNAGLTQAELAPLLGVSARAVRGYEASPDAVKRHAEIPGPVARLMWIVGMGFLGVRAVDMANDLEEGE